ncbi:MAG: bacteriophage Gp15 family protein [Ruminococcus sp.]|nr:bacteriophage Gp15 family protein [Ruminococcus sp.]
MIGILPKSLEIGGNQHEIRSDFRIALLIFEAFNDADLSDAEKAESCLKCLYKEIPSDLETAYKQAIWFLDGGNIPKSPQNHRKVFDWKQDESLIFPAVNKSAGFETRLAEYIHWWTFLGYFSEIGEGLFSQVINIRTKKSKGKKLEKWEREFYAEHREMIDLKRAVSGEEQAEIDRLNALLGGG